MQLQKEVILKMLFELKAIKIPASAVEKELGFSNGLLGKGMLSDEKSDKFYEYYFGKTGKLLASLVTSPAREENVSRETLPIIPRTKLVVEKTGLKEKPSNGIVREVDEVMVKLNKDFGAGTVMYFGDKPNQDYQVISTGSISLDIATGIGGLPRGRIIEIFGWESSGKTTIALNVIANAQKQGLKCLLVDAENAFDPEYAAALDIIVDELQYCQPSCGEEGLEVADKLMSSGKADIVVIDSVAALIPKAELEGLHGDSKMGLHARLMSQACRKLVGTIAKHNCICIFINQFRHKIGNMYWESPEVTTGGKALQFYASMRLEVRRSTTEKNSVMNGDTKEGNQTTVKVIKNKCAPPFRNAQFNILYGSGIDRIGEVVDLAIEYKVIEKSGSWYSFNGTKLGQGKESIREIFENTPELQSEIENKINNHVS